MAGPAPATGPELRTVGDRMRIDRLMPSFDATRIEHRVVAGSPGEVYAAAVSTDLLEVGRRSRAVRVLFAVRAGVERLVSAVRGSSPAPEPEPDSIRLAEMPDRGEWVALGADPPRELAFGSIGRFWGGKTEWERIDALEFADFDRPGYARIGCSLSVRPYGEDSTLLSYEARTEGTDQRSKRAFLRYWRVVSPLVGMVMRATLKAMAREAERGRATTV